MMSHVSVHRFVKEKRPTISPNFNFLGQLLDFEKKLKSRSAAPPDEPEPGVPEEHLLTRALCSLQLGDDVRPKRALDISEPCQFSPERSPAGDNNKTLQRSGSVDGAPANALKGWHSDMVLGPSWFLSSESTRFYGCAPGLEAVRRRGRQRSGDGGDSRRSWHEESSFEKQLKHRSCQMDGMTDRRSREERSVQASFSGSVEIIQVSWGLGHVHDGGASLSEGHLSMQDTAFFFPD